MSDIDEIADMGEESGRDEAADDYPFLLPIPDRHILIWRGRGRAQGMYRLRGRAARVFARAWAQGYFANCDMYRREGLLVDEEGDSEERETDEHD
jgi:hypothetical protein